MQLIGTTVAASGISAQDLNLLILGFAVFGFVLVLSIVPFVSLVMIIDESGIKHAEYEDNYGR